MKKAYISRKLRRQVLERAGEMCEYCLSKSDLLGTDLEVEHIIPESLGGVSSLDNLCASCSTCNRHKASKVWVIDPDIGKTICGRATVETLQMNRERLVRARRLWVAWGEHPPRV